MKIMTAVLCDYAADYNGRLSIMGTFNALQTDTFPYSKHHVSIAVEIEWGKSEEGMHTVDITFMNQDGKKTLDDIKTEVNVLVPEGQYFILSNHVVNLQELTFQKAGMYLMPVWVDGIIRQEIQLQIIDTKNI